MAVKFLVTWALFVWSAQAKIQCRDEKNSPVDWYVLYKLPRESESKNPLIRDGEAYVYITEKNVGKGWVESKLSINDTKSIPGRTLDILYTSGSNRIKADPFLWIQYNDQPPNRTKSSAKGHTKGVVVAEKDGGFWLVHSVPNYPPEPSKRTEYTYPDTGVEYGQSFLCISLNASQMDLVGIQLKYNEPKIFSASVPKALEDEFPKLKDASTNAKVKSAPWYHKQELTTLGGQVFVSFAKTKKFMKELYDDWVAPSLETNLLVETWRKGSGDPLDSDCKSKFTVENVASLDVSVASLNFPSTRDHSKWAIADEKKDWVCVGDINRMKSQEKRGGGSVCTKHNKLWPSYKDIISGIDPCPKPKY